MAIVGYMLRIADCVKSRWLRHWFPTLMRRVKQVFGARFQARETQRSKQDHEVVAKESEAKNGTDGNG